MTDHIVQAECEYALGGIPAAAILDCDHGISDFSNGSQWTAAISAGKVKVIKNIKAEVPDASAVDGESATACGPENEVYTFDRTAEITDYNVNASNVEFYDKLNTRTFLAAFYLCDTDELLVVEQKCNASARLIIPRTKDERQHFLATIRWRSLKGPKLFAAPAGIF